MGATIVVGLFFCWYEHPETRERRRRHDEFEQERRRVRDMLTRQSVATECSSTGCDVSVCAGLREGG